MRSNQIRRGDLAIALATPERAALDKAFVAQCDALPARPQPRSVWDDVARRDERYIHPNAAGVELSKRAMRTALETENPTVIALTKRAIEDYWHECLTAALAECPADDAQCPTEALISFQKEACEAVQATTAAQVRQSPTAWQRAKREARDVVGAAISYVATVTHIQQRQPPATAVR